MTDLAPADERSLNHPAKRTVEHVAGDASGTREVFISNIPYNVSEAGITTALKRIFSKSPGFVGVKKVTTQRGLAMVEFASHSEAGAAVQQHQDVKIGPRTLSVKLNDPGGAKSRRYDRDGAINDQRNKSFAQDTHPNPDCWFCLANPGADKHLIFAVDPSAEIYLSLSKGCIAPMHSFICPVTHYGCFAQASDSVKELCLDYSETFINKLDAEGKETIIFERWIPMNATAANHMQIHLLPIDKNTNHGIDWRQILKENGNRVGIEFMPIGSQKDVSQKLEGIVNRVSYMFMSFPVNGVREHWLGIGKMSFTFPREVLCEGLACPERIDWRACEAESDAESSPVEHLKSLFSPS